MNFVSIFSKRIAIAGIEVGDTFLRLVQLVNVKQNKSLPKVHKLGEVKLNKGVIVGSSVKDIPALTAAIKQLVKVSGFHGNYAIASIPISETYSKIHTLPLSVSGSKLNDAMNLAFDFQSPITRNEGYADWETVSTDASHEVLFMAVPKAISDDYIHAFQDANVKLLALEVHPHSMARAIITKPEENLLFTHVHETSASITIIKNKAVYFCRTLSRLPIDKKTITDEMSRIKQSYEVSETPIKAMIVLEKAPIVKPLDKDPRIITNPGAWIISLGAAIRGLTPRSDDTAISLLSVGTEDAYRFQRANVVAEFLTDMTVVLSVFFSAVFLGAWLFMVSLQNSVNEQLSRSIAMVPPPDSLALENKAKLYNNTVKTAAALVRTEPRFSMVLAELQKIVPAEITVQSLSLSSPEQNFNLNGMAASRNALVAFRNSLQESNLFADILLPLNNLELKQKIPFTITFRLRDPKLIFPN